MACKAFPIGETKFWAVSISSDSFTDINGESDHSQMALHFVIDNSGSMGSMTTEVTNIFSNLVDSVASKPCSLTLFTDRAWLQSAKIQSSQQMVALPKVAQGMTNITAGIRKAMEVITLAELSEAFVDAKSKTHHILILLTDGLHNSGPPPSKDFPLIGKETKKSIPDVRLSVVVVGITKDSSTSMGMLLKTNLETVPLDTNAVDNIYFAASRSAMRSVTQRLIDGLSNISTGSVRSVHCPSGRIVAEVGDEESNTIVVQCGPNAPLALLLVCEDAPNYITVGESKIEVVVSKETDHDLVADILTTQINKIKIKRVASSETSQVRQAIKQLNALIDALEQDLRKEDTTKLVLAQARAADRLAQHRRIIKALHMGRELRNQLAEVANFAANCSEEQASFLTGSRSKYASKALKRAAVRSGHDGILDPKQRLASVWDEIRDPSFAETLINLLRVDAISHLKRLSHDQREALEEHVKSRSKLDLRRLRQIMIRIDSFPSHTFVSMMNTAGPTTATIAQNVNISSDPVDKEKHFLAGIDRNFIDSGTLSGYLNDVFFGQRQSYLSLMSPWEHINEWREFVNAENQGFKSQWELLLFAGSVAYPVVMERSAGTQMNPFQLSIKKVHTTMIDTASLCCANHSGIDTYGPEAGMPIKDALVLIDPSCPKASAKIASTALLGETYTSVVLARDLHMYSGALMKAALHAHALFRCLKPDDEGAKTESDAAAEIRREFLGRAYQCASCGFGPVVHGGCSSLSTHHGEGDSEGGVVNNSCPSCGWFSPQLSCWLNWDGTIPPSLLHERMGQRGKSDEDNKPKLLEAKADMVLRILYSFRKTFPGRGNPIRTWYGNLAKRLVDWDLRLTTQDEVEGLVQVLVAVAACDDDVLEDDKSIDSALAPPVVLAIVNEACARAARKKLRKQAAASAGVCDDAIIRKLAADRVTSMLGITKESAPETAKSLLDPEPSWDVVKERCRRDYDVDYGAVKAVTDWVECLGERWCTAFSYVGALRSALLRRGGGWDRLERDMETSLEDYADVVEALLGVAIRPFAKVCDIAENNVDRTLVTMAAQAFLHNRGADRQGAGEGLPDVCDGETLRDLARDMRMRIYSERVREKMAQWKCEGEQMVFLRARAADIGQYAAMVGARSHAHGLSKEDFWGLWEAAVCDGFGGEKARSFLEKANTEFQVKHAPDGGELLGKKTK